MSELAALEQRMYENLIKFLASEKVLKGTAYYPAGGTDFSFACKGVLVIHDPFVINEGREINENPALGTIRQVSELINSPQDVIESYDTLIIKCGLGSNQDGLKIIYKQMIDNLVDKGCVIEWSIGMHADKESLGLIEHPINKVLAEIVGTYEFKYYDICHKSLDFKVWLKKH